MPVLVRFAELPQKQASDTVCMFKISENSQSVLKSDWNDILIINSITNI